MARRRRARGGERAPSTLPPPQQLQLAQLVAAPPAGDDWLHEQKFDGYRIVAELDGGHARLSSRRFNDWTAQFPTITREMAVQALEEAKESLLDRIA